jgi:anti-sigma factor RsiW
LLGGRVDKLAGHDTAVLAYQLRKHIISAFVSPTELALPVERLKQKGFNILHWSDGVMQIWALTDADMSELERFGSAWRSKFAAQTSHEGG